MLDLAKIESGKMEALAEDFEVASLIDEVSATSQPLMAKNENQLRIERGDALGTARQDLTAEDRRSLSGRVEQVVTKDAWSHEQLADLVHKLASRPEVSA